ncbi:polysaccharide deacetylase family protein [Ideonella sp. BN130291]|uniref:polysaccharide deacetylase family protein n=1 Tax=Ideonella sp. BN130291 TaxID=3112940 RepID=UPI002E27232C|nr:polysaccharide deacetylase family protein [Ideonella sp. BN130291]
MAFTTTQRRVAAVAVLLLLKGALVLAWWFMRGPSKPVGAAAPAASAAASASAHPAVASALDLLKAQLAAHRQIIVLLADEASLSAADKAAANSVGQQLFHEQLERQRHIERAFDALTSAGAAARDAGLAQVLDYVESGEGLYDADRLAFQEALRALQRGIGRDGSLPAVKLHKRVSEDLDALAQIEHNYDREIGQIFNRFETRAIELKRERWADYVAHLKTLYRREQILKDHGVLVPYPPEPAASRAAAADDGQREIFGNSLPARTVVLTFDDGPHRQYTEEVEAILKQYNVPAVFFQVGRNLGQVGADGKPALERGAQVAARLQADGFVLGNHSYTHAQLSKETGDALKSQILYTDTLLKAVSPQRSPLFRFPYGARNAEGLGVVRDAQLRSVMWNIDSLDWADPVPRSIADRVLREVDKQGRGIILFHDIHERTLKALPLVLDRLVAEGYQFAGWRGSSFESAKAERQPVESPKLANADGNAWALVIGVDDYAKWPRLQYAVRDAKALTQALVERFGVAPERVVALYNKDATRQGILDAFHGRLAHGGVQKNDRVFVFFAGHGATRTLSSGRELGYIVPADAGTSPEQLASDAIPMTEIQNIAESLAARHVLFVMDACYSGLGLTRGGAPSSGNFLRDNARRLGRQMITAGGADQLVADGGPNGHSVFTWTLLQGLGGKGDLNGDGIITATELAAYVAPAVASVSRQTPAFGSLPGSEGGEFVFVLPSEGEFLSAASSQLSGEAIQLNTRLDAALNKPVAVASVASAPVAATVKDLQGKDRVIEAPVAVAATARQRAQLANDRGLQLYREKRYAEAEAQFTEALKLRPDFALAANNLGFVYYKQNKFAEAARWYDNALKLDPSRAVAYLNLGDAHANAGDKDRAAAAYKTYLELAPSGPGAAHAREQLASAR